MVKIYKFIINFEIPKKKESIFKFIEILVANLKVLSWPSAKQNYMGIKNQCFRRKNN